MTIRAIVFDIGGVLEISPDGLEPTASFGDMVARWESRLGIASEINARATIIPSGFTAERLATGEADLAVQQISELKQVEGIEVVGPIPHDLQTPAVFSAARMATSSKPVLSDRLLRFLASREVAPVLRESGLER